MTTERKHPWEPMALTDVGHLGEVLQKGGGKLSIATQQDHGTEIDQKPPGYGGGADK